MDNNMIRGGAFLILISSLTLTALALSVGVKEAAMVVSAVGTLTGVVILHAGLTREQS